MQIHNLWKVLILGTFLFSNNAYSIEIAILDTGYCLQSITSHKKIKINPPINLTSSTQENCNQVAKSSKRRHGQWIIENALKDIKDLKTEITITPYILFNKNGRQNLNAWKTFLNQKQNQYDLIVSAIAYPYRNIRPEGLEPLNKPTLLASGQRSRGITKKTKLWPHEDSRSQKSIIYIGTKNNKTETYSNLINVRFSNKTDHPYLNNSSLGVSKALNRVLMECVDKVNEITDLKNCLKKSPAN